MKFLAKRTKKLNTWDIGLIKWAVMAAVLFILTIWPALWNLVESVNPWYFFAAFVIFVARPFYRFYIR